MDFALAAIVAMCSRIPDKESAAPLVDYVHDSLSSAGVVHEERGDAPKSFEKTAVAIVMVDLLVAQQPTSCQPAFDSYIARRIRGTGVVAAMLSPTPQPIGWQASLDTTPCRYRTDCPTPAPTLEAIVTPDVGPLPYDSTPTPTQATPRWTPPPDPSYSSRPMLIEAPPPHKPIAKMNPRELVAEFTWCMSNTNTPTYLEDPMPMLAAMIDSGVLANVLWRHLHKDMINPLWGAYGPEGKSPAHHHPFNSALFDECSRRVVYDDWYETAFGREYSYPPNFREIAIDGYREVVCNREEWIGLPGYEALRGYILERMYRTEVARFEVIMADGTVYPLHTRDEMALSTKETCALLEQVS